MQKFDEDVFEYNVPFSNNSAHMLMVKNNNYDDQDGVYTTHTKRGDDRRNKLDGDEERHIVDDSKQGAPKTAHVGRQKFSWARYLKDL